MSYLTNDQLEAIRHKIEEQRNEIVAKARLRSEEDIETETRGDEVDIATVQNINANLDRMQSRDVRLLKKLDEALVWLEDEDFGYCEECGVEIGFKRLHARPATRMCIDCKEEQERSERGYYHPRRRKLLRRNEREL